MIGNELSLQVDHSRRHTRTLEIVTMYARNVPLADIQYRYSISRSQVSRIARMYDLPKRPKCFDPAIRAAVVARLEAGDKLADIATLLNVSQAYISKVGAAEGLNRYKRVPR